jgi:hypothetical protein
VPRSNSRSLLLAFVFSDLLRVVVSRERNSKEQNAGFDQTESND